MDKKHINITPEEHEMYLKVKEMRECENTMLFNDSTEKRHALDIVLDGIKKIPDLHFRDKAGEIND